MYPATTVDIRRKAMSKSLWSTSMGKQLNAAPSRRDDINSAVAHAEGV
jgi:hypothetical protein